MITRDEALVLLRSGQMPESRYVQLCYENGWGLGTQLLNEAANALDDKDAEIKRLRAEVDHWRIIAGQGIQGEHGVRVDTRDIALNRGPRK